MSVPVSQFIPLPPLSPPGSPIKTCLTGVPFTYVKLINAF